MAREPRKASPATSAWVAALVITRSAPGRGWRRRPRLHVINALTDRSILPGAGRHAHLANGNCPVTSHRGRQQQRRDVAGSCRTDARHLGPRVSTRLRRPTPSSKTRWALRATRCGASRILARPSRMPTPSGRVGSWAKRRPVKETCSHPTGQRSLMALPAQSLFMHCLPAHRGDEVTDDVVDRPRLLFSRQAEKRLDASGTAALCCPNRTFSRSAVQARQ